VVCSQTTTQRVVEFSAFKTQAYADSLYRELIFEKAPTIEFPAPDWPGNYYQVVDTIKNYAENYFAQLDLFPEH